MSTYWYMSVYQMCPVCGEEKRYRYRVYGSKPKDRADRMEFSYINHYCYV